MSSSTASVPATTSREASGVDKREVLDVLSGNLSLSQCPLSRNIRVFLSSEWSDTIVEKEYLSKHAIPKLRQFCQSQGIQFHTVDLYSALPNHCVTSGTADTIFQLESEGALKLALKEIKLCQRISSGANFVTLLAQKYGHKPLHTEIPEDDFTLLVAAIEDPAARELVHEWYKLDTNAQPCQYVLQLSRIPEKKGWSSVHDSLSKTIRKAAKIALGKNVSKAQHYIMSAVEQEVSYGIFNLKQNPNFTCFWMKRTFTDLLEQNPLNDGALVTYSDLTSGRRGLEFDSETMKALNHLKEARLPAKYIGLDSTNIHEFYIQWHKNKGLDPDLNQAHSEYLTKLGDAFVSTLCANITDSATLFELEEFPPVYHEALCHGVYAKDRAQDCWNRPDIISKIDNYITSNSTSCQPLVVYGCTGSGKTCIIANTAYRLREKFPLKNLTTIVRFLGTTPLSTDIRNTLRSICEQLSAVYQEDPANIPGDYKSMRTHFIALLSKATTNQPVVLFLDGVDRLSSTDGASGMSWLPLTLPPNVKIILSTSSEVRYDCYPVLQSLLYTHQDCFVEVPSLTLTECREFLRHSLAVNNRQLTPKQEDIATRAFHQCPLPLYLQFLMKEILNWCSYTTDIFTMNNLPPATLNGVIETLFKSLEAKCGHSFVSHTLGYITASKHGLTEVELLDILTNDNEVMMEVNRTWRRRDQTANVESSQLTFVPPMLWSQLYHSLLPFLELRMAAGGYLVYCWSHRHLKESAAEYYLMPKAVAHERYEKLAEYFRGCGFKQEENCNITTEPRREALSSDSVSTSSTPTLINNQPLMLNNEQQLYNVRKLVELPNSLEKCGRFEELQQLLTDYNWLKAYICTLSCPDVIEFFSAIIPVVPLGRNNTTDVTSHEVRLLRDSLSLSIDAFNSDSAHLPMQLLGRLMPYVTNTNEDRRMLKSMVIAALEDNRSPISALQPHFHIPGGPLLVTMEGHRDVVSGMDTAAIKDSKTGEPSLVIVTSSWDKTLKSWDLKTTGVLKTFDGHTDKVLCVALTTDGQYAVSGSADKTVRYWFVPAGEALYAMTGHTAAVSAVVVTGDGCKTISGSFDTTIKFWNTDISSSSCGQLIFTVKDINSPIFALSLSQNLNLAVGCKNGSISVINTVSASIMEVANDREGAITALASVEVDNCLCLVTGSDHGILRVREFDSGRCLHLLEKPKSLECGSIKTVAAGPNGKIVASYSNEALSVYDAKSGQHLFELRGHRGVIFSTSVTDGGSLAFSGASDHSIHVWDLLSSPVIQSTLHHSGNVSTVAISLCETYGVSGGDDAVVKIYDLESMKVLREISTDHDGAINDVLLMRDMQHLITASKDGTIKVWNGQTTELDQTLYAGHESGVNCIAITADSELLMSGGDDNKIMFWSLKTGKNLKTFTNHSSAVIAVHFSQNPNVYYMISASSDGILCVRDFYTANMLLSKQIHPPPNDLTCLVVSSNASFVATGSNDGTCRILSLPNGKLLGTLVGHRGAIKCVNILRDNATCLTASEDCTLRMWDTVTSESLTVFRTDLPLLSCDIGFHRNTILFGAESGCVSAAVYQQPKELSQQQHSDPVLKLIQEISESHSVSPLTKVEQDTPTCSSIMTTTHSVSAVCDSNGPHNMEGGETSSCEPDEPEELSKHKENVPTHDDEETSHAIDVEVKIISNTSQNLSSSSIDITGSSHSELKNNLGYKTNGGLTANGGLNVTATHTDEEAGSQFYDKPLNGKEDVDSLSITDNLASVTGPRSSTCNIV